MISKKVTTQKGFRLPEVMVNDLEKIATLTGRSQNELVEYAIGDFVRDNVVYLIENDILDNINDPFTDGFVIVYGDMLLNYDLKDNPKNNSCVIIDIYQLDEKTLTVINTRFIPLTEEEKNVLEKYRVSAFACIDKKTAVGMLHDALAKYNYNSQLMQEWIKKQYSY